MKDYHSTHLVPYEPDPDGARVWCCLPVCEYLKGKPWNDIALACVSTLRPSSIRVTRGEVKTDARTWRVTVYVDEHDIIEEIEQEVQADVAPGINNGHHLKCLIDNPDYVDKPGPMMFFGLEAEEEIASHLLKAIQEESARTSCGRWVRRDKS